MNLFLFLKFYSKFYFRPKDVTGCPYINNVSVEAWCRIRSSCCGSGPSIFISEIFDPYLNSCFLWILIHRHKVGISVEKCSVSGFVNSLINRYVVVEQAWVRSPIKFLLRIRNYAMWIQFGHFRDGILYLTLLLIRYRYRIQSIIKKGINW